MDTFKRTNEKKELEKILSQKGPAFLYIRGRRRVGKSWLLKKISSEHQNILYFMGALDAKSHLTLKEFVSTWSIFSKDASLLDLKNNALDWKRVFYEITKYVQTSKKEIVLIFDEIQWIAKEGSGFIGKLKEAWLDWESLGKIKVIICGSSNKFFSDKTGGDEKILRGLKTHSDIIIRPFSFRECVLEKFSKWRLEEAAIAYMMTGGVAYYLNQIDEKKLFIHALNDAFFLKASIFLEECDEVLRLDFNKKASSNVRTILEAIGINGSTQAQIIKKTKIPDSTVFEIIGKLEEYSLIDHFYPHNQKKKANQSGGKYIIKDFYLNTYFSLLLPLKNKIKANQKSLLFANSCLKNTRGFYIENYTGYMYERLVKEILNSRSLKEKIFSILGLKDEDFEISCYWDQENQIDLIVDHRHDRISRALEIKWAAEKNIHLPEVLTTLENKNYPLTPYFSRQNFIVTSECKGDSKKKTKSLITLKDLI